ncbi:hypothetical protein DVH24_039166 [Malus domestica]|uniref:J domain-containing protein n=1 Tax=Malus domestica TaxID=3750 RepID=A0A498KH54_MALDO|nr:hypothetical protein DVH24_039166 [Malus domestica]
MDDDLLLKNFFAEVSEVERDNQVLRILSCFKLNPFEYLNLPFDACSSLSLMVHPDKCKHPKAKEAFGVMHDAIVLHASSILNYQVFTFRVGLFVFVEGENIHKFLMRTAEELKAKRKKQLKKDTASKIKSLVDEGKYEQQYEQSEEFQQELKMKISEEEGRLKKGEEETKEMWKRKREHEEQWEGTREQRVSSWRDFTKGGKKAKKVEIRPPKLKTEDPNKSYVQRPVKRG